MTSAPKESARDRLIRGLAHARNLLPHYEAIPTGVLGACMIRDRIREGEKALKEGNELRMGEAANELLKLE